MANGLPSSLSASLLLQQNAVDTKHQVASPELARSFRICFPSTTSRNIAHFCLLSLQDQCEALKQYFVIKQQVSQLVNWCFEPVSHHNTTILCITITTRREQVPVYEQD